MKNISRILSPPRTAMEVFNLLPEGTLSEVVDNILYMSPAASHEHQRISRILLTQMHIFIEKKKLGEVFNAPLDVLLDKENAFQPDIIFISKENKGKLIPGGGFEGVPDLVIEILSSFNKNHDLVKKKKVYEQVGVKEYWVIDPVTRKARGFTLDNNAFQSLSVIIGKVKSNLLRKTFNF
ncbi:MAG: Uma2 family endonuclease [Chitinophagales bacterium]|nr:Uma2 family endonuclease [Chitinophagales bacterium]